MVKSTGSAVGTNLHSFVGGINSSVPQAPYLENGDNKSIFSHELLQDVCIALRGMHGTEEVPSY